MNQTLSYETCRKLHDEDIKVDAPSQWWVSASGSKGTYMLSPMAISSAWDGNIPGLSLQELLSVLPQLAKIRWWGLGAINIDGICRHCNIDANIQPPKESECTHVHYPEDCEVCSWRSLGTRGHARMITEQYLSGGMLAVDSHVQRILDTEHPYDTI